MSKVRVYELARELKMESKALVDKVKQLGIDIASHQSTLTADQVQIIKKDLQHGGDATNDGSPKVIRRRRRPESAPAKVEASQEEEQPVVVAESKPQSSELEGEEAKPSEAAQVEPSPEVAESSKESQASEHETVEEKEAEVKPQPSDKVEISAEASSNGEEAPAPEKLEETPVPEVQTKPVSTSGATIVRRASPEEVQARRQARQQKEQRAPSAPVRKDWKGVKPSLKPSQPDQASKFDLQPANLVDEETFASVRSKELSRIKEKDKKRTMTAEEEAVQARKLPPKQKRDQFNLRAILDQIEDVEAEVDAPVPLPGFASKAARKKTVYTPSSSNRKRDLKRRRDLKKTQITTPKASLRVVKMGNEITVGEFAKQLSVKATEIITKLMQQGMMVTINQTIDFDTATLLASEYEFEVKSNLVSLDDIFEQKRKIYDQSEKVERPPIVTIMGHVDHGKTSILDAIRKAKVASGEAGGITQHIGAYTVDKDGKRIAFLDTPGHEAFSSMRARGAQATDIVVLVVAADDGVMPQTIEAISHAKDAGVPIIVAVNKMDKPNINLDRVYRELMEQGIQSEEWGGETQFVKVSALQGTGLDDLLEAILLQAEVLELRAVEDAPGYGVVVEAHLDKGRGPVATLMVQQGTLRVGDQLVVGTVVGRVRAMYNHLGQKVNEAFPSTPVEVIGLSDVPMAGDSVDVVEDEKTAREAATWRQENAVKSAGNKSSAASLEELLSQVQHAETPEVPIILKADTQGSAEAIAESVLKLNTDRVRNRIVHKAVGGVNESDLSLAETSNAVIIAFNVRAVRGLDDIAEQKGILIRYFSVIYDIVDVLKAVMAGKLPPIQKEVIIGHAEVRQTIRVPKIGTVAGTAVLDGKVTRNSQLRLIRDDVVIFSGKIGSLRRFKDDVKEVVQGYECGIGIEGYNDVREGDVIETFVIEEEAPAL